MTVIVKTITEEDAEFEAMRQAEAQNDWIIQRSIAYPDIKDQLDMLYWDGVNGTTVWADTIAQVKTDIPKP